MKKYIAFLLCLITVISLFSCGLKEDRDALSQTDNTNDIPLPNADAQKAMEMYGAAINDEICVFDERLGEIKLKSLRLPSNGTSLDACKLLTKAILDIDQDGVNEYVIKSPDNDHIVLRYYEGKVYSYWLDTYDFYNFNTDGTFYWYDPSTEKDWEGGLNRINFDGEVLNVKSVYGLKYTENPAAKYEYFVDGKSVTEAEYDSYRNNIHNERIKFSQFELSCSYPITAEQAWDLANAYWDNQDGHNDVAAGTVFTARIVLVDTPDSERGYYRVDFQVESRSNGGGEGDECKPPYDVRSKDQILVNALTGEITASTYDPNEKGVSVEEAIEIAKNDCDYIDFEKEGNAYRVELAPDATAPDHIYVIVIQKYTNGHYSFVTEKWIDKNTGESMSPYYINGKG